MKNFIVIGLLFVASISFAQVSQINGQVLDAEFNEEPLAFAEVKVKGLDLATFTDENGRYELELTPGTYNLEIGFIGYETRLITTEIAANGKTILSPVLLESKRYERESGQVVSDNVTASR